MAKYTERLLEGQLAALAASAGATIARPTLES
jgi:hypothetical protein